MKTWDDVKQLFTQIQNDFPNHSFSIGSLDSPMETQPLTSLFQNIYNHFQNKLWNYKPLLQFLDEHAQRSPISNIHFEYMESQVRKPLILYFPEPRNSFCSFLV
jgi:hypothetical protein